VAALLPMMDPNSW